MTKVALLTDIHFGARNDSLAFHLFFEKFYLNCFFPYLVEHGIKTVILGGDTFDRRKYINFLSLRLCKDYFFDQVDQLGIRLIMNIGNHDVFYKNTNDVNSPELLFNNKYELVFAKPRHFQLDSLNLLVVPWITSDNYEVCMDTIRNTAAEVMYGHLELSGFEMNKGVVMDHGMNADLFAKFDMVLTGHYHHKSHRGNIHYLGSPYEITWADYDDPRGFHVLDTETRELTFVENPFHMFYKLTYNDTSAQNPDESVKVIDYSMYKDCFVKVVVSAKTQSAWFDIVIDKLERAGCADLQVVEDHLNLNLDDAEDLVSETEDTSSILRKYISSLDVAVDRKKLENVVLSLYNQAIWATENDTD